MIYIIYKTTNLINGKFYIGKHQTKDLNDGYIGSGKLLKRAIQKYKIDNFHTEILHICKDEKHMNLLEKILVVPDPEINYNLCEGGKGGFGYINKNNLSDKSSAGKKGRLKTDLILQKQYGKNWRSILVKQTQSYKTGLQKMINNNIEGQGAFYGKKHTKKWRQNHSAVMKEKQKGKLNSQYGTCWITNGAENKKIKKKELDFWLDLGYTKGRKMLV